MDNMTIKKLQVISGYDVSIMKKNTPQNYLLLTLLYQNADFTHTTGLMVYPGKSVTDEVIPSAVLKKILSHYEDHIIDRTLYYRPH